MCECMCVCGCVCILMCMCGCVCVCVCMCGCVSVSVCVCMSMCMCMNVYVRMLCILCVFLWEDFSQTTIHRMIAAPSISSKSHNGYLAAEAGLVWKCSNSFLIIMHLGKCSTVRPFKVPVHPNASTRGTHMASFQVSTSAFARCGGGLGMRLRHTIHA